MAKGFKRRICRVIIATLQSCRSKDPSDLQENPVSSISRSLNSSDQNHGRRCRASSEFISMGATACGLPSNKQTRSQEFKWQKEEKWHVVGKISEHPTPRRKICSSTEDDPSFEPQAPPPSAADERKIRVEKKKNKVKNNVPSRLRVSTSSPESGWFSSEGGIAADDERDEEETKTLVSSSLSFSTDSSLSTTELSHTRRIKKITCFQARKSQDSGAAATDGGGRYSGEAVDFQEADTGHSGRENERKFRDRKEVGGSVRGFPEFDDGYDS